MAPTEPSRFLVWPSYLALLDSGELERRGLLVRHLVLPGDLANTETVLAFLAREISTDTYLNLMDQYHPCYKKLS